MKLLDKLESTKESNDFFHGTVIDDAESILNDSYIFSSWFTFIRKNLRKQGFDDGKIWDFLHGLYDILPPIVHYRGLDHSKLAIKVRAYFDSFQIKPFEGPKLPLLPKSNPFWIPGEDDFSEFFHREHGVNLFTEYGKAFGHIYSHLRAQYNYLLEIGKDPGKEPNPDDAEGVVFQMRLPVPINSIGVFGWLELDFLDKLHIVSKQDGTKERILNTVLKYNVGVEYHNHVYEFSERIK